MGMTVLFTVSQDETGERIDKYLTVKLNDENAERAEITRSAVALLAENGEISVNNKVINKSYKVKSGDIISVNIPDPRPLETKAQDIPLDVIYEDDYLLVVNKPQGMVVHPASGNWDGTLVNALLAHCGSSLSGINGVIRPGIVHRIDKNTSGLLIVAKTNTTHLGLAAQIKDHSFLRVYQGIVYGKMNNEQDIINAPVGRHPFDRKKMTVTEKNSRSAVTHYHVIEELDKYTFMEFTLETGRTHQIRVHMSSIGHAIVGDSVYAPKNSEMFGLAGQCLHAKKIGFIHPVTNKSLEFDSPLPEYFLKVLEKIRNL